MAKKIEPINIWVNGETQIGEFLQVTCSYDNYQDTANNSCKIFTKKVMEDGTEQPNFLISESRLTITGQDYINWGDQPAMKINEWIYNWSASQLNLIII